MKLLTVGDSFTFGAELTSPSNDSWPVVLAQKNNWTIRNRGKAGGSNDRIVRIVFEELPNKYDLIVVAWTSWDRFEVKNGDMSIWTSKNRKLLDNWNWVNEYYKHAYDDFYAFNYYLRQVVMLQNHLKQNNQKYIFCNTFTTPKTYLDKDHVDIEQSINQVDLTYFIDWPYGHMCEWMGDCPKGPGNHPLELGHQRIAERINEHIRHLGWIS